MVTIEDAVARAMVEYVPRSGIVGVGRVGNTIVFYVESESDASKIPSTYAGYPTTVKVVGKVIPL